jgi:hypothetical protein
MAVDLALVADVLPDSALASAGAILRVRQVC